MLKLFIFVKIVKSVKMLEIIKKVFGGWIMIKYEYVKDDRFNQFCVDIMCILKSNCCNIEFILCYNKKIMKIVYDAKIVVLRY